MYVLGSIAIVAIGIIFFHGATGTLIGYGAYIGNLIKYLTTAIVAQLPFDFMIGLIIINSNSKSLNMQFGLAITVIMYGAIIFWYVNKKIMPQILSQNQRRKRRKK